METNYYFTLPLIEFIKHKICFSFNVVSQPQVSQNSTLKHGRLISFLFYKTANLELQHLALIKLQYSVYSNKPVF